MPEELPYDRILQDCLRGELRLVNAGLPCNRNSLSDLLCQEHPYEVCNDGGTHFFRKKELEYLASMLSTDEQEALLLPMLIEIGTNQAEAAIICEGEVEVKVVSKILNMYITPDRGRIRIYRPQLTLLRKILKTTTQYVFSPKIVA